MTPWQGLLLVPAGIGAGLTGSIAGLASLISYPTLLAFGVPPVTANVTNTVALVFNSVGSVSGSRPELRGERTTLLPLAAAGLLGGLIGAVLLLSTPSGSFERIVPWLIGLGALAVLLPRRRVAHPHHARPHSIGVLATVMVISVYGGYFGAAAGVLMLALFLNMTADPLPYANARKNLVLGCANFLAAAVFVVVGTVDWAAAVPLALGLFIGGRAGPAVVRRAPVRLLQLAIGLAGLGLAVHLGIDAYR